MSETHYPLHDVWESILSWWEKEIPPAVDELVNHGAAGAAEWLRQQYDEEEGEELAEALSFDALAPAHRGRVKRNVVGSVLELLSDHRCGLTDLEVRVNLDHRYNIVHPKWSRLLMRELKGRRVCVWAAPL